MRDRPERNYEVHEIARIRSASANVCISSRELVNPVSANAETSAPEVPSTIVVIDRRALVCECFARCLKAAGYTVVSFPNVDSWLDVCDETSASLILFCIVGRPNDPETQRDMTRLGQRCNPLPTILLSDTEEPEQVVDAIGRGARGYIPTSAPLEVVIEVIRLVRAGGVFVPASSLIAARRSNSCIAVSQQTGTGQFTERQVAVMEGLRRGKANKIIAYELNMRESTVKVHVRNIMKKLKARNRTEVAFMTNEIMQNGAPIRSG
jgi:DNA-binding NarL/FixJ family response regulator